MKICPGFRGGLNSEVTLILSFNYKYLIGLELEVAVSNYQVVLISRVVSSQVSLCSTTGMILLSDSSLMQPGMQPVSPKIL